MSEIPLTIFIQYKGLFCKSGDTCWCPLLSDGECQWSSSSNIRLEKSGWKFLRHQACIAHTEFHEPLGVRDVP